MKYFAYILSFIVIALTVNPCIDGLKDSTLQKSEISHSQDNSNHQNDTDHCSPFCTCQCCQSSFFVSNIKAASPAAELEIRYIEYSPSFQSLEQFDFFIPPKS
jgi:hypothetical protein